MTKEVFNQTKSIFYYLKLIFYSLESLPPVILGLSLSAKENVMRKDWIRYDLQGSQKPEARDDPSHANLRA